MTYNPCLNLFKFLLREFLGWRKKKSWEGSHCLDVSLLYTLVGCVVADCRPILAPSPTCVTLKKRGRPRPSLFIPLYSLTVHLSLSLSLSQVYVRGKTKKAESQPSTTREREREREKETMVFIEISLGKLIGLKRPPRSPLRNRFTRDCFGVRSPNWTQRPNNHLR